MTTSNTVHIIDDEPNVRKALSWLLSTRNIESVIYADADEFLSKTNGGHNCRGCILLDIRMDGTSGLELFDRLRASGLTDHLPVIFLTGHGSVPLAVEAVQHGAFDFFEKPFNDNRLIDRIADALAHAETRWARKSLMDEKQARFADLTPREKEVMHLILEGKLNKGIAYALGIGSRTVEVHRSNLFAKVGVKNAVELAQWAKDLL